ncbi:hypothetical protein SAMN05216436_1174 [bacterium A37T11]|nr:hypothetical protein SAMN05216436_1174 [bacterium A37T11]
MIDSLHIELEEVYPPYTYSDKAPANCAYRASYMKAACWKAETCRITLQGYNAKHALVY